MNFYKLKHLPTELYFKPSRYPYKENLSKIGKSYSRKPSLGPIGATFWHNYEHLEIKKEEWVIEKYATVLEETIPA